jgi:hypothetical protein
MLAAALILASAVPAVAEQPSEPAAKLASTIDTALDICSSVFDGRQKVDFTSSPDENMPTYIQYAFSNSTAGQYGFKPINFHLQSSEGDVWVAMYVFDGACSIAVANTKFAFAAKNVSIKKWEENSGFQKAGSIEKIIWKSLYVKRTPTTDNAKLGIYMKAQGTVPPLEDGQGNQMQIYFIRGNITVNPDGVSLSRDLKIGRK